MQVRILKNDFCPFIEEMNALIGQTLNVVGIDDDFFQVEVGYWFDKGDVEVIEPAPDTVTISRPDLQALQSLLKEEIKDLGNFSYAAKSDAKHFLSSV